MIYIQHLIKNHWMTGIINFCYTVMFTNSFFSIDLKICNYLKSRLKSELNHEIHQNQKQFHDIEDKASISCYSLLHLYF
jgi:hypothetical protein